MSSASTSNCGRIALTETVAAARLTAAASADDVGEGNGVAESDVVGVTDGDGDAEGAAEGRAACVAAGVEVSVTLTPHAVGSAARPAAAASSSARVRVFISVPPRHVGRKGQGAA
jgi:hypothetical protein